MAERTEQLAQLDPRLGRHVRHDERNKQYRAVTAPRPLQSVRHRRRGRSLNQGQIGACTFFALCHALKCEPLWRGSRHRPALSHGFAVHGYQLATTLDPFPGVFPPDDTGSSGQAACQAGIQLGALIRYDWAFGAGEGRQAIMDQPVMQGTVWTETMFHPDRDGRVHPTGAEMGGHEYTRIGMDVERRRSWYWQTWGKWGLDDSGLFYMTWDDEDPLIEERHGDLVVPRIA